MKLNPKLDFTEISKLFDMLVEAEIPCELRHLHDGLQVSYPDTENCICDAICLSGSYGCDSGLLEIMGLVNEEEVGDSVEGYLTAAEVFERIKEHYSHFWC